MRLLLGAFVAGNSLNIVGMVRDFDAWGLCEERSDG